MRGRQTATAYCQNAACHGSAGITSHYTGDTWESPGWWEPEECPHCSGRLLDERVDAETITSGLIDELHTAGLLDESTPVDETALLAAIQAELHRQHLERTYRTIACPECAGTGSYEAPNSVWPPETLDLTCVRCGGSGSVRVRRELEKVA